MTKRWKWKDPTPLADKKEKDDSLDGLREVEETEEKGR